MNKGARRTEFDVLARLPDGPQLFEEDVRVLGEAAQGEDADGHGGWKLSLPPQM